MTAYPDNFNRADGALGGNWVAPLGHVAIVGGQAKSDAYAYAYPSDYSENGDQDHYIVVPVAAGVVKQCALWIRYDMDNGHALRAYISMIAGSVHVAAGVNWSSFISTVNWDSNGTYPDPSLTVRLKTVGTIMTLYVNGSEVGTWDWQGYSFSGALVLEWIEADAVIDALDAAGGASATITVTPDPLWVGGGDVDVLVTGTDTSWTTGVPGSSTVTVDHGTVSDQWTEDASTIHLTYTPDEYVGAITFTESQYGAEDTVNGTVVPPEGGGDGECKLTDLGAAIVNRTGEDFTTGHLLTDATPLPPENTGDTGVPLFDFLLAWEKMQHGSGAPVPSETGILNDIVRYLVDSVEITPGENVFTFAKLAEADANALHVNWDSFFGEDPGTLATLKTYLAGTPGGSHQDILDALAAGVVDLTPVLDAIAGVKGDPLATIKAVLDQLFLLGGGGSNYTLNDVMGLLDFITSDGVVNLNSVLSTLATMRGDNSSTLHAIQAYCVTAIAKLDEIKTYLQDQLGPMTVTLAAIEAKVDAILALLQQLAVTRYQPPVWPGLDHVELLDPSNLATHLTVVGPMDGVNVHISSTDGGTGFYDYDTHRCWRNIGALAFYNDAGFMEAFQPLGWTAGIYVPKTMTRAAGVRFHLGRGPEGWVTPWRVLSG